MRLLISMLLLFGCNTEEAGPKDTNVELPGSTDPDTEPVIEWTVEPIEAKNAGDQADLAVGPDGTIAVAYFTHVPYYDGQCDELSVENLPLRVRHDLRFAEKSASGDWSIETLDSPLYPEMEGPSGLSLAFNGDGEPAVAYTGGPPEPTSSYCSANDAMLAVRSGGAWTEETVSAESNDSFTDRPESQAGYAVGWWSALAYDTDGNPAVIHQDVHFLTLQGDDKRRADAEFAWRQGGAWTYEAVDPGEGAGDANDIIFDAKGRPIVFYAIPVENNETSRHGVWAARRAEDGTWETVQIHTGSTGYRISAAMDPAFNEPVAAFYSGPDYGIKIRRFIGDEDFTDTDMWTSEIVRDARYDEGQQVSLAFAPDGTPALAYFRCKRYDAVDDACIPNDEALVFALQKRGEWKMEVVEDGDILECGMYPSLAFDEAGDAHIAFQCVTKSFGVSSFGLFLATKKIGASK